MIRVALSDNVGVHVVAFQLDVEITKESPTQTRFHFRASGEALPKLNRFLSQYSGWDITVTAFEGETFDVKFFDETIPVPEGQPRTGRLIQYQSYRLKLDGTIVTSLYF